MEPHDPNRCHGAKDPESHPTYSQPGGHQAQNVHEDGEAPNEPVVLPANKNEIQGFSCMMKWRPMRLIEVTKNEVNHGAIDSGFAGPVDIGPVISESIETKASNVRDEQRDDPAQANESVDAGCSIR